jgi:hypothetical protein
MKAKLFVLYVGLLLVLTSCENAEQKRNVTPTPEISRNETIAVVKNMWNDYRFQEDV